MFSGLTVHGPSGPLVAPLGSSLVLPCYVDEPLLMERLEVEWRRTDSETFVHLFQDGESRPEAQSQDYQDRAHFFTEEIKHRNFSLRLDHLRAEDEGRYTCTVHSQLESGETEVQIKDVERLLVSGSDWSISASVGEDVTLNCSVDSHIKPEHLDEVSWKKINKENEDEDVLVLLYQNNKTFPGSSDERYRDRAEFFTAEIPRGNFSVRLKSVRTEDKGVYMCHVFAGRHSANATVVLDQLGFSVLHIIMLILCVSASGSALLLFCLIYCRSTTEDSVFRLQMFLVFCPNILMCLAFVLWGLSEGSVFESVCCSALYFLRPLMLLWTAPYINNFTGNIKTWIRSFSFRAEYIVFSAVFYSVLFKSAYDKSLNYAGFEGVMIIVLFVIALLLNLLYIIYCKCFLPS
ncbi:selection and upkeep of intraepithelial T-cells protein 2-like [Pimephales promelas]|uniref:selection and upkeep of intraepithelial T-cells protein 2-like n=1 Tax=Pimephales promelas TaxID=90988 RepID=UPI001955B60D|nr:selection and upkeep of intraepithelial T-cells protein 2-like [Pimephales promelas]